MTKKSNFKKIRNNYKKLGFKRYKCHLNINVLKQKSSKAVKKYPDEDAVLLYAIASQNLDKNMWISGLEVEMYWRLVHKFIPNDQKPTVDGAIAGFKHLVSLGALTILDTKIQRLSNFHFKKDLMKPFLEFGNAFSHKKN